MDGGGQTRLVLAASRDIPYGSEEITLVREGWWREEGRPRKRTPQGSAQSFPSRTREPFREDTMCSSGPSSKSSRFAPPPPGACRYDHGRKSRPRLPAKLTHGGGRTPRGTAPHLEPLPDARRRPISNAPRDKWMREAAKEAPISCCHASHQYLKSTDTEVLYLGQVSTGL